ncbi:MAG: phosphatase PAP2 family protein [Rhizobiales bacterium]|nr:phosphatase PAP2 family protein [Hyphomicrobiales bacterium]
MALFTVRPTRLDQLTADFVAEHTNRTIEHAAGALTWAGDEHVLTVLALGWWIACRNKDAVARRRSDHILLTAVAAAVLPHIVKKLVNQERPDRRTVYGHLHGVPFSGNKYDAFPSGHALHAGALASAATTLAPPQRNSVWAATALLLATRVVLLAHWTSDVAAGFAMGVVLERLMRFVTGYGRAPAKRVSARAIRSKARAN